MNVAKTAAMTHISLIIGPRKAGLDNIKSTKSLSMRNLELARSSRGFDGKASGSLDGCDTEVQTKSVRNTHTIDATKKRNDGLLESSKWTNDQQPETIHFDERDIDGYIPVADNELVNQSSQRQGDDAEYDYSYDDEQRNKERFDAEDTEAQQRHQQQNKQKSKSPRSSFVLSAFQPRASISGGSPSAYGEDQVPPNDRAHEDGVDDVDEDELYQFDSELDIEIGSFLHKSVNTESSVLRNLYRLMHDVDIVFEHISDGLYHTRIWLSKHLFHHAKRVVPGLKMEGVHGNYCFCGCRRILT
jgi:hypothetical protein